jgi:opacity protein-like surface antigen
MVIASQTIKGDIKMKKGILAVAFMFLLIGKMSFADHEGSSSMWSYHNVYIEPRLEAFIPFEDGLETTLYVGGDVGYEWNEWWAFFVSAGWAEMDIEGTNADVSTVPILFNARFNLWPGVYVVDPYIFGGIGVSLNDTSVGGVEIDDSFAGQIGAGAEYWITEQLSASLQIRFFFTSPDVSPSLLGDDDIELNALQIGAGLKWRF